MAYEPTEWGKGDVITSAKLNKLENGVAAASGGGALLLHKDATTGTLDKTWKEISDAFNAGLPIYIHDDTVMSNAQVRHYVYLVGENAQYSSYGVMFTKVVTSGSPSISFVNYVTSSEDGYPVFQY